MRRPVFSRYLNAANDLRLTSPDDPITRSQNNPILPRNHIFVIVNVPLVHPCEPVGKLKVPFAMEPRYASVLVLVMVPLEDPEVNANVTFTFDD